MSFKEGHIQGRSAVWLTGLIVVLVATTAILSGGAKLVKAAGEGTFAFSGATTVQEGGSVVIGITRSGQSGAATATLSFSGCSVAADCPANVALNFTGTNATPDAPYTAGYTYTPSNDAVAGSRTVTVTLTGSGAAVNPAPEVIAVTNGVPTVTLVSPNSIATLNATQSVLIVGTNLNGATQVLFGGTPAVSIGANTGNTLAVTAPGSAVAAAVNVTVTTPVSTSAANPPATTYTYASGSVPTVTSISPTSVALNTQQVVQVYGTNFVNGGSTVTFGSAGTALSVTFISSGQLTVTAPAYGVAGPQNVTVATSGGTSAQSVPYTYGSGGSTPTVTQVSPNSVALNTQQSVQVYGSNFINGGSTVSFGSAGNAPSVTFVSSNQLTVTAPAYSIAGPQFVTVTTVGGTSPASVTYSYGSGSLQPTFGTMSPQTGTVGTTVTITGTNFQTGAGMTSVYFGGLQSPTVNVQNANLLTAVAPNGSGFVDVAVCTLQAGGYPSGCDGYVGTADDFTFTTSGSSVTITGMFPQTTPTNTTPSVTITGTGFQAGLTQVTFAGVSALSVSVTSANQLTATAPSSATGARVQVRVVVNGVTSPDNAGVDDFTYTTGLQPTISLISPNNSTAGQSVTITGTNFVASGTTVTFGGTFATVNSSTTTQLVVTVPSGTGLVQVVAGTSNGQSPDAGAADDFTYTGTQSSVTISSVTPNTCPTTGLTSVIQVTGTGFVASGMTVTVGGTTVTYSFTSANLISFTCPAHTAGTFDVVVVSGGITSPNTAADDFTYTGTNPAPTITSVSPTTGAAGTSVTITGTGFTGATSVTFGGIAATTFSIGSDTSITATVPSSSSGGTVDVFVVTPSGTNLNGTANKFAYPTATNVTITYTLTTRWTLIAYDGVDNIAVLTALKGLESPDDPATNDVSNNVTAVYYWNAPIQNYQGFFPRFATTPGANDLTVLRTGQAYWIAVDNSGSWTTHKGN